VNKKARILVVDDELSMRQILNLLLTRNGYEVDIAVSAEAALVKIKLNEYDLILSDLNLPNLDGLALMRSLRTSGSSWAVHVPVILITGYGTTASAVEAMKEGASDYILKPFDNEELLLNLERTLSSSMLSKENVELRRELNQKYWFENLVGSSSAMIDVYSLISRVKDTRINCLVYGESGTGKELVAQSIHYSGMRRKGPFVAVNCGAIPENLIESELFGYRKGAFTGADRDKPGYFQVASGGTLFLDEIGDMPPQTQVKVLRALAERKISPLGGGGEIAVDIRVVAASNKELDVEVAEGRFREDLYYRLNVIRIDLPPLRERIGDIPLLAAHFVREFSEEHRKRIASIAPDVFEALGNYSWPGNVRELRNVIEGAVALSDGEQITMDSLPRNIQSIKLDGPEGQTGSSMGLLPDEGVRLDRMLLDMERAYLQQALDRTGGRKTEAARLLGMSFRSFRYRLAKYGMDEVDSNP